MAERDLAPGDEAAPRWGLTQAVGNKGMVLDGWAAQLKLCI